MTREEAIEILTRYKEESEEDYYVKRAKALTMAIKALEQESRWIPVEEKLPEIHNYTDRYLVTLERGWVRTARFTECDGNHWWSYDDVVAWMSLPQPYREVEEYKEKKYVNR
jgi:hypothetical protein